MWTETLKQGAKAADCSFASAERWAVDFGNNQGKFSALLWSTNCKTSSILHDVETRSWCRAWDHGIIDNMGNKHGAKNSHYLTSVDPPF